MSVTHAAYNDTKSPNGFPTVYLGTFAAALEVALNRKRQGSHQVIRIMKPTKQSSRYQYLVRPYHCQGELATRLYVKTKSEGRDEQEAREIAHLGSGGGWY